VAKETKVTRISAKDTPKKATKTTKKAVAPKRASNNPFLIVLMKIGGYFRGAWQELKQVRWPTRRATWELTLAVVLFTTFFLVLIVLLDLLFKYVFEIIIA
jgi:preprotein translocase SecE subunit